MRTANLCARALVGAALLLVSPFATAASAPAAAALTMPVQAAAPAEITAPAVTAAAPVVHFSAALTPERLGAGTTIGFGLKIDAPPGEVPAPLRTMELLYPEDLGVDTSGLGFETCEQSALERSGPQSCPADSYMGYGSAVVEVPLGPQVLRERTNLTLLSRPVQNGNLGLLFYAEGRPPIATQLVFPGAVLPIAAPFGGNLSVALPILPTVPEGPDASIVRLQTTLGPSHLTYYERVRGKTVAYRPKGVLLPQTCPHGGFRFLARLSFADGTQATAPATVPCPRRHPH
jgi:hypothetical protein